MSLQFWQVRVAAWPGLLTLLSLLAVVLGTPARVPEQAPRLTAGNVTPLTPELRAAPQPSPGVPLLAPPAPTPEWAQRPALLASRFFWAWSPPAQRLDLTVLGRRQTDGG
ncbi:hypothetical protein HNQ07_001012 [Deinococcus metalli]|uniref:Uncharacterized protein n=1 Tax=Deinococcus metalli TaxID=1141878 RepID=A0A7W8KD74_9DEIO|nr:hypothetical protein [Deinococcus metalli]MBB5375568.1 hypothetical protein [Deinococcus metalli]GHF28304.1 hypothetical protein GCM10017781_00270 [Deinococcus metalli]